MEEELSQYKCQVTSLDEQLALDSLSEETRRELLEMRSDLMELVNLLEMTSQQEGTSSSSLPSVELDQDIDFVDADAFIGLRVSAPFTRFHLPISHHSAIVFEVLPPTDPNIGVLASVLYSNPLLPCMKPCAHFLKSTCRFGANCKFNHGEVVPMKDFEEYIEPDFSSVQVGSLVLLPGDDGVWDIGRLQSHDAKECAIKLLRSGKEVSSANDSLIPLRADIEIENDECSHDILPIANDSWSELKGSSHGSSTVGGLGQWSSNGFGLKMMQKMGYLLGEGLGKNSDGIVHAVQAKVYPNKKGLEEGVSGRVADGQVVRKRVKRALELSKQAVDIDIFSFLNRKLAGASQNNELVRHKEDMKVLEKCSDKSLGVRGLDLESQLKQLQSKKRKLEEGIARNRSDQKTVDKLSLSVAAVQKDINKLEGNRVRLNKEIDTRNRKKKDIF